MTSRIYITKQRLADIATHLTPLDRQLLHDANRFRLISGAHLARLHFGNIAADGRRCRRRLTRLVEWGVLDRLPRRVGGRGRGSDSHIFRVGRTGRRLLDINGSTGPSWQPSEAFAAHTLAIADLYLSLVELHRAGRLELIEFTPEPSAWRNFSWQMKPTTLKPDAFVKLRLDGSEWSYFIEIDRGTESAKVISRKLDTYLNYLKASPELEVFPVVLFLVDSHKTYHSTHGHARVEHIQKLIDNQRPPASEMFVVRKRDRPPWLDSSANPPPVEPTVAEQSTTREERR